MLEAKYCFFFLARTGHCKLLPQESDVEVVRRDPGNMLWPGFNVWHAVYILLVGASAKEGLKFFQETGERGRGLGA